MTRVGELKRRITIEQKTRGASDGAGGYLAETWATLATVWAKIDPRAGRELVDADQVVHRITHVITIRARTGITTAMRVVYQTRTFAIVDLRELMEGGRWMEMQCEETQPS